MANQITLLEEIKLAKKYEYKKLSDMPSLDERKLHLIRAPFDAQVKSNRNSITKSFIVKVAVTRDTAHIYPLHLLKNHKKLLIRKKRKEAQNER